MHHHCEVWIPTNQNIETQVAQAMAPYYEGNEDGGEKLWDWYQIGGRWKGAHIPGYNPSEDPEHMVTCSYCGGTGARNDEYTKDSPREEIWEGIFGTRCNVCDGNGVELLWPTKWESHLKDTIPISEIPEDLTCATLILPNEALELIPPLGIVQKSLRERNITTGYLVTVDYHS